MDILKKELSQEKGLTIIEVVVAQVIMVIVAMAIWGSVVATSKLNAESEDKTIATNIAQLKIEEIESKMRSDLESFLSIESIYPAAEIAFDTEPKGTAYWTRNSQGEWIPSLSGGKYQIIYPPVTDADPTRVKRIKIKVSWDGYLHSGSSVSLETLVSKAYGDF